MLCSGVDTLCRVARGYLPRTLSGHPQMGWSGGPQNGVIWGTPRWGSSGDPPRGVPPKDPKTPKYHYSLSCIGNGVFRVFRPSGGLPGQGTSRAPHPLSLPISPLNQVLVQGMVSWGHPGGGQGWSPSIPLNTTIVVFSSIPPKCGHPGYPPGTCAFGGFGTPQMGWSGGPPIWGGPQDPQMGGSRRS